MSSKLLRKPPAGAVDSLAWSQVAGATPRPGDPAPLFTQPVARGPGHIHNSAPGGSIAGESPAARATRLEKQVEELQAQLEHARQETRNVREQSLREGEAAGRASATAAMDPVLAQLAASLKALAELRPRLRAQAEADLVRLALAIARRVLNRELHTDEEAIIGLVRVAFGKLRMQETSRVRVHPSHHAVLVRELERQGADHVEVCDDAALPRGGVVFETTRGNLDVSADTQFREIERGLTDRIPGGRE